MPGRRPQGKKKASSYAFPLGRETHTDLCQTVLMKKWFKLFLLMVASKGLFACNLNLGSIDFPGVYKISIPQGNIITQDMVDQLRPGMSKRQVVFVMGTPLVRDPYFQDRWDYVYNFQPGGGERGQERLSIFFVDDQMVGFEGDFVPSEAAETTPNENEETTD